MHVKKLTTLCFASAICAVSGCAEPIMTEIYSRTPTDIQQSNLEARPGKLRIGLAAEGTVIGGAFIVYAGEADAFEFIGWAQPVNIEQLDYQIECSIKYEYSGSTQNQYCLARLTANVYNADHSHLLDRVIRFQEAMYTSLGEKKQQLTHDNRNMPNALQQALFKDLVVYLCQTETEEATGTN